MTIAPDSETETEIETEPGEPTRLTDIPNVGIYVSTFPEGEGLIPGDWSPEGYERGQLDYNPNRILTAEFIQGAWNIIQNGVRSITDQTNPYQLRLPKLTAGQTYHWAVQVKGVISSAVIDALSLDFSVDSQSNTFTVPSAKLDDLPNDPFTSVTVLTRGIEQTGFRNQPNEQSINAIATKMEREGGSIMKYYPDNGWQLVKSSRDSNGQIIWQLNPGVIQQDKPLVLLADWIDDYSNTSAIHNAGFAEAAADAMFASLVQLDNGQVGANGNIYDSQGNLVRTLGSIFKSPLHFVGFGQGAVVNSEIIQRIGTYFPKDRYDIPDIQMTTVDPFNYSRNNSSGTYANILDPAVTAWENVSYVDNYTGRQVTDLNLQTDWDIDFRQPDNSEQTYAGFDEILSENDRHQNALLWYAGTANVSYDPSVFVDTDKKIYRRLGDLYPTEVITNPELGTNWYTPDHTDADFEYGDNNAPWEGIGTGWFHSVLGGGYDTRPYGNINNKQSRSEIGDFEQYLRDNRTPVGEDNTASPSLRGDFAVPTLFNGNFDAISQLIPSQPTPGWSLTGSGDVQDFEGNFFFELDNNSSLTHQPFVVPDWGVLRFDLATLSAGGELEVTILEQGNSENSITQPFELIPAGDLNNSSYYDFGYNDADNYKIGQGFSNFETFHLEIPDSLRGKAAVLSFSLQGHQGSSVLLDDVFFKSEHLLLGQPTQNDKPARADANLFQNNYLVERPQYTISYSDELKGPNWVAYKLDRDSIGSLNAPTAPWTNTPDSNIFLDFRDYPWIRDSQLPFNVLTDAPDYRFSGGYDRGHMVTRSHQNITDKDQLATYFTSSMLPQHEDNNRFRKDERGNYSPAWLNFENFLRNVAKQEDTDRELYIFSGGLGFNSAIENNNTVNPKQIKIPDYTWKISVLTNRGDDLTIIPPSVTAIVTPNTARPSSFPHSQVMPDGSVKIISTLAQWQDFNTWKVPYKNIENWTGTKFFDIPSLSASLLADSEGDTIITEDARFFQLFSEEFTNRNSVPLIDVFPFRLLDDSLFVEQFDNVSVLTDTVSETKSPFVNEITDRATASEIDVIKNDSDSFKSFEAGFPQVSPSEVSPSKNRASEIGSKTDSISEIAVHDESIRKIDGTKIRPSKITTIQAVTGSDIFTQLRNRRTDVTQIHTTEIPFSSSVPSEQFFSSDFGHNNSPVLVNNINNTATKIWSDLLQPDTQLDIDFQITDLPTGQLAEATITSFDDNETPNTGTILIDHDANGVGWFIDSTPLDNSEFSGSRGAEEQGSRGETYLLAPTESEASGKYDLLTTVLHELAHLYGFVDGYQGFDANIEMEDGTTKFIGDDFEAVLDGEHLDREVHPYDLMNTHLSPGVRKLPSELNVQILQAILAEGAGAQGRRGAVPRDTASHKEQ